MVEGTQMDAHWESGEGEERTSHLKVILESRMVVYLNTFEPFSIIH